MGNMYSDPRLRFIINPGTLDNPGYLTESERNQHNKRMERATELVKDWEPKLLNIIGDEFEVKNIIKMFTPKHSAALAYQDYSKSILNMEMINDYIQDAHNNGGFKCEDGSRTRIFKETEFANAAISSLTQLTFIGVMGKIVYNMAEVLEGNPNKKIYVDYLKQIFFALREVVLNKKDPVNYKAPLIIDGFIDLPTYLSDNFFYGYLTDNEIEMFKKCEEKSKKPLLSRATVQQYKLRQEFYEFCYPNGFQGIPEKRNYLSKDLDKDKMFEFIAKCIKLEMKTFLDLEIKDIDVIINSYSKTPRA